MSIRVKLLLLFVLTLSILSGVGLYAVSIYNDTLNTERSITETSNQIIELSRQAESYYHAQLNAWKNILLRGSEAENYHRYLQSFYQSEREAKEIIATLSTQVTEIPIAQQLTADLVSEHRMMGRKFREAIRVFNSTDANAGSVADHYVTGVEDVPTQLLQLINFQLHVRHDSQLLELTKHRKKQESILFILVAFIFIVSLAAYLWLTEKIVVQPAERATYLADVIDNAQRVAKFGTWDWDSKRDQHYWSEGLYGILNISQNITPSQELFLSTLHADDREHVHHSLKNAILEHTPFELEARIKRSDGTERVIQQRGQVSKGQQTNQLRMTSIIYDITERKESEKRLSYLANFDALTSMPNRNLFLDRLKHAMAQAERKGRQIALLFMDLDKFKAINDALGHQAGDTLLIEVANRIKKNIRDSDTAARLGGDEFTIILEQIEKNNQVAVVAENLLAVLNQSYLIENNEVFVTASIGITLYPDDGKDVNALLKNADSAMYYAKAQGRSNYHFFTEELNQLAQERLQLENGLRMALQRDQFQLHYQPQIELESGRITGAEALLRWVSDGKIISPAHFIPLLEETGLIVDVGSWVLEQACKTAKDWENQGLENFKIAVNLAARQLRQPDIKEIVEEKLHLSGLAPEHLEIELTESTLIDTNISRLNLERLEILGIRLAIDDFGTGYSSLSYLKQYSVDVLKIDQSFIKDINKDKDGDAITSAIVALSHKLDIKVIAEGVETIEQLEFLKALGCDQAQGFLIARPMLKDQFENWVEQYRNQNNGIAYWFHT